MDSLTKPEKLVMMVIWNKGKPMTCPEITLETSVYEEVTIRHAVYKLKSKGFLRVTDDTANKYRYKKYVATVSKEEQLFSLCMSYDPDVYALVRLLEGKG